MENSTIIKKIKDHAQNRLNRYLSKLSLREQQFLINEVIRIYDYKYDLSLIERSKRDETLDFIDFSFPIVSRYLYKDYNVIGFPLIPSSPQSMQYTQDFLNICFKIGLMENYEELLRLGILKYEVISEKHARLSYTNKYNSIERIEKTKSVKYSHAMMRALDGEYYEGFSQLPRIIEKMEKLVFIWNSDFIGYDADPEVDDFFIQNAQLDFVQATEWDSFPLTSFFGGVPYHYFLSALIAIESICLKHLQFVEIATKKYPWLEKHNILPCVVDYEALFDSLSFILGESREVIETVMSALIYNEEKRDYYSHIGAPNPLFLRVSSTQLLRSFSGCIYRPIEFMLAELKRRYPNDWSRNSNEREQLFKDDLYKYFKGDRFIVFDRNIEIVEDGNIITDIDACIIDKETYDIAFIQLKWQDSIYESTRSLISKRNNFVEKVTKWVDDIEKWIYRSSEKRIADYLHLSPHHINKKKIKIFVIGRHNANFSGNQIPYENSVWCQWYSLIEIIEEKFKESINIQKLFELIHEKNPYFENYPVKKSEILYGNYLVELEGPTYNQA